MHSKSFSTDNQHSSVKPVTKHRRVILTEKQAVQIYSLKFSAANNNGRKQNQSSIVAEKYGVSPKTIRDIWNRKTWTLATHQLFRSIEDCSWHFLRSSEVKSSLLFTSECALIYSYVLFDSMQASSNSNQAAPGQQHPSPREHRNKLKMLILTLCT